MSAAASTSSATSVASSSASSTSSSSSGISKPPRQPKPPLKDVLRMKILSMGDGGVGKTSIIKRYCEEKFQPKYISTIGVDFGVKPETIIGRECRVNFWDLSGHPEFFEVRNEFYKDTQGIMLVFDVTSRKSFESLDSWLREASSFGASQTVQVVLCANKVDLVDRQVTDSEAANWAKQRGMKYFEMSAKSGLNVADMIQHLFKSVVDSIPKL